MESAPEITYYNTEIFCIPFAVTKDKAMKNATIIELASYQRQPTSPSPSSESNEKLPPSEELGQAIQLLIQQLRNSNV